MKKQQTIISVFVLAVVAVTGYQFSGGPAASRGQDRTGSPIAVGTCQNCHSNGSFSPTLTIEMLENGVPVTQYEPGKAYKLKVTPKATVGTPNRYGFQAIVLNAANKETGVFSSPGTNVQLSPISSGTYAEHAGASTSNTFEVTWTAPAKGTGKVTVYSGGNAVNGNGGTSGDNGVNGKLDLTEKIVSSTKDQSPEVATVQLFPNPAHDFVQVTLKNKLVFNPSAWELVNISGKQVAAGQVFTSSISIPVATYPKGAYWLRLVQGDKQAVVPFVKQ